MNSGISLAGRSSAAPSPVSLQPGDPLPRGNFRSEQGKPFGLGLDDVAGTPLVLLLCPSEALPKLAETLSGLEKLHDELKGLGARVFVITSATTEENVAIKRRCESSFEFLSDSEGLLIQTAPDWDDGSTQETSMTALVVRSNGHVMRMFEQLSDPGPVVQAIHEEHKRRQPAAIATHPPVLIVPDVLSRKDCQRLITTFAMEGNVWVEYGKQAGVQFDYKMRVPEYGREDRVDHVIMNQETRSFLATRLRARLLPEIDKAFRRRVTPVEDFRILSYQGSRKGWPHGHRDNTLPSVAHRRFAMSINLNSDEFKGGGLQFPEYGEQRYRPETGTAIVFSCSVLHEALEVEEGCRYVLVGFFGDEKIEKLF
jgi:peroxiredoxin